MFRVMLFPPNGIRLIVVGVKHPGGPRRSLDCSALDTIGRERESN